MLILKAQGARLEPVLVPVFCGEELWCLKGDRPRSRRRVNKQVIQARVQSITQQTSVQKFEMETDSMVVVLRSCRPRAVVNSVFLMVHMTSWADLRGHALGTIDDHVYYVRSRW